MTSGSLHMDLSYVHRSHLGYEENIAVAKLDKAFLLQLQNCVVKLRFNQGEGGESLNGTGFYINIPGAEKAIILTAGHNLISEKRELSTNLKISDNTGSTVDYNSVKICAAYEQNPGERSAVDDYGAILLPEVNNPRRGFGFCLRLSSNELKDKVYVTGYKEQDGEPVTSDGHVVETAEQLQYMVSTEQGMSGAPVWFAYEGFGTVVGIHNYGPAKSDQGSRGTAFNEKVLRDICKWTGVGHFQKRLRSYQSTVPLYLHFSKQQQGRMCVNTDEADACMFDVLPAYVRPGETNAECVLITYLPGNHENERKLWVQWNPNWNVVDLVDTLRDSCLVSFRPKLHGKQFRIIKSMDGIGDDQWELRMDHPGEEDDDVSVRLRFEKSAAELNRFCFE
ncbi:hypothetical protein B0O99DRAFT_747494 [Bisporella sp. PMI_857]|nr:hypothetical protein B0O99DRAFT_747494 [Bisporella sp. PMI_857]